jgi:hypothetical protein
MAAGRGSFGSGSNSVASIDAVSLQTMLRIEHAEPGRTRRGVRPWACPSLTCYKCGIMLRL